jgi:flagellar biosynthesis protein FlhB
VSESGEKRFDAPPSRIAKARREGNVPRAQEFGGSLAFIAASLTCVGIASPLGVLAQRAIAQAAAGAPLTGASAAVVALAFAPLLLAAVAASIAGILQSGGLIVTAPSLKFERLQPVEGVKRMVSREALLHGVRALVAFTLACVAMLPTVHDLLGASVTALPLPAVAAIAWRGAQRGFLAAGAIGLLFGLAEYGAARRAWLRKLRMTFAEFKRELKESDGDPLARSRRRSLHRSLVRGAVARMKEASFVVVNPTHVAVALAYRPPEIPVPVTVVRVVDELALRARELAAELDVPVIENVALARSLYRDAKVDTPIPHEYYVAVAEVVAALMRSGALGAQA